MTTAVLNTKISEVENKIPDVNGLVKKRYYNRKTLGTDAKYFTTSNYNKFTSEMIETKIEKGLVDKYNILNLVKNSDLNTKIATKQN